MLRTWRYITWISLITWVHSLYIELHLLHSGLALISLVRVIRMRIVQVSTELSTLITVNRSVNLCFWIKCV